MYSFDSLNLTVYGWNLPHTKYDYAHPAITIQQIHPADKRCLLPFFFRPPLNATHLGEVARRAGGGRAEGAGSPRITG
jgi:hypothetical protein